jgi:hypothetical protein
MATNPRLYDTYEAAAEAVQNLLDAGIPRSDISVVSNSQRQDADAAAEQIRAAISKAIWIMSHSQPRT